MPLTIEGQGVVHYKYDPYSIENPGQKWSQFVSRENFHEAVISKLNAVLERHSATCSAHLQAITNAAQQAVYRLNAFEMKLDRGEMRLDIAVLKSQGQLTSLEAELREVDQSYHRVNTLSPKALKMKTAFLRKFNLAVEKLTKPNKHCAHGRDWANLARQELVFIADQCFGGENIQTVRDRTAAKARAGRWAGEVLAMLQQKLVNHVPSPFR